ncbi:TPM domain-containing protein [Microbacterium sediminicola]|uniref:TPM domain-containing protein n=1 Tax=Microbacterium sediminicola TaxID=415210 RepID=A0ABP4TKM1_9MICO
MRAHWPISIVLAALLAVLAPAGAHAADPVTLGAGYVLDEVGALSSAETAAAEAELAHLYTETGVDLYVAFVDTFENPSSSQEWADEVAAMNGLGPSQYLLAVATESRQFYTSADSAGPLSEAELTAMEAAVKPELSDGDYAGAITAAVASVSGDTSTSGDSGVGAGLVWALVAVIAIGIVWWIIWAMRRRRARAKRAATAAADAEQLARQASSALVATDDAIRTSAQEVEFARAGYGDAAVSPFESAISEARALLTSAFAIQQQLDDATPDTPEQIEAWNTQIVELCERANGLLDEKARAFDELRQLEKNAPAALAALAPLRESTSAAIENAEATLAGLASPYHPDALSSVADNPRQARDRIAFADERIVAAQTALEAGDTAQAAIDIRGAEDALAQAADLEKAIDTLASDLAAAVTAAGALIAELEGDIVSARALPDPDGRLAGIATSTARHIDQAREMLAPGAQRPLRALQSLEAANAQIDQVMQAARDAQAQAQRASQMLAQVSAQAGSQISATEDFIASRRGAVGAEARTRLSQAQASLAAAQQSPSPTTALPHAQRAAQLAGQALSAAQRDVGSFGAPGYGQRSGDSGAMLGAVLGGIVMGSMMGGGRRRGGFGGGMPGGFGGGRRSGGFSGGGRGRRGGGRF